MKNKVSIVVPVYKVEKYLEKCINSIINQTLKEIEIILVDDGSPDKCGEICDYYSKLDNRVRVIHKINNGLAEARNSGMDIATGEYICFVDSDDWVEPYYVERMYNKVKKHDSDICMCGFYIDYQDENYTQIVNCKKDYDINGRDNYGLEFIEIINGIGFVLAWNKLYRLDLLKKNNIKFSKDVLITEDLVFNCKVLKKIDRLSVVGEPLYHYIRYDGTILSKYQSSYYEKQITKLRYQVVRDMLNSFGSIPLKEINRISEGFYLVGIHDSIYNLFRKDCNLTFMEKNEIFKKYIFSDDQASKIVSQSYEKGLNGLLLKFNFKIGSPLISVVIYTIIFKIRYCFDGLYKKFRKKGI